MPSNDIDMGWFSAELNEEEYERKEIKKKA